eukprot:721600-Hanusia_phi.AAC.3
MGAILSPRQVDHREQLPFVIFSSMCQAYYCLLNRLTTFLCLPPLLPCPCPRPHPPSHYRANSTRASELEALGCKVMGCQVQEDGQVDLNSLLFELTSLGMKSVMVEGGAKVGGPIASPSRLRLSSFFSSPTLLLWSSLHILSTSPIPLRLVSPLPQRSAAPKLAGGLSVLGVPAEGKVAAAAAMAPHAGRNQGSEEEVAGQGRKTKELAVSHPASRILRALQTLSSSARCLFERLLDKFLPPRQGTPVPVDDLATGLL